MAPDLLLGIDIGNTVVKAVLFDLAGPPDRPARRRRHHAEARAGHGRTPGGRALGQCAGSDLGLSRQGRGRCRHASPPSVWPGHGNGLYLLDRAGQPLLGHPVAGHAAPRRLRPTSTAASGPSLHAICLQRPWPSQTPVLLAWVKTHRPEIYARAGTLCFAKDIIGWHLTGDACKRSIGHVRRRPPAPARGAL